MRPSKFNFIPAYQIKPKEIEPTKRTATLNIKQGYMYFSTLDPEAKLLVGKYLKFYVDPEKKTFAWKVFDKGELSDLQHVKLVEEKEKQGKPGEVLRYIRVGIGKYIKPLDPEIKTYKKLEISVYNSQDYLDDRKPYYYVTVK